jgi:hypothetical protein
VTTRDPLDGILIGPVIFAGPAIVAHRPLDPRQGNEWTDLGSVVPGTLKITYGGPRSTIPTVEVPYDEMLFADEFDAA